MRFSLSKVSVTLSAATGLFLIYLLASLLYEARGTILSQELFTPGFWDFRSHAFHALSMFWGSFIVSMISLILAIPLGLGAAIFCSEYLRGRRRAICKVAIEMLAGVPSVIYGLLGMVFLGTLMAKPLTELGGESGDSLLTAGILLAVMILPTVMTFSDDALRCVPKKFRENALSLGLTQAQTIFCSVLPQARKGILAAIMLAWGRAVGETIAIYMVVGRADAPFVWQDLSIQSIVRAGQTLTTKLGGSEIAIAYGDHHHWGALMGLGVYLWVSVGIASYAGERMFNKV
jgi:phosphate transport system permease protein